MKLEINKILILLIILTAFYSCSKEQQTKVEQPYYLKSAIKIPMFDKNNVYKYIEEQIAFGPRNPNSMGHQQALKYLETELRKSTDAVELQNFSYNGYDDEKLDLTNIIAKFNSNSKDRIFICAHWDSRPRADQDKDAAKKLKPILGTNDGASGVGIILELAQLLKENPVNYGIDLILFDGEDYGKESDLQNYFLGSKYFAASKPTDYQPYFGILLDLVGDKEAIFYKEGKSIQFAPEVVDLVWNIAQDLNATPFSALEGSPIEDDHIPLNQAGLKTIDIVDIDLIGANTPNKRRNYWHTSLDTIDNIGKETLQQVGDVLTHLIYSLEFGKPNI
ncbi:MAG: M28 family peptidase [Ignavibacteriales bacterium]|nr:M28 family peptidase [Ignavibacteriales bacterium]